MIEESCAAALIYGSRLVVHSERNAPEACGTFS